MAVMAFTRRRHRPPQTLDNGWQPGCGCTDRCTSNSCPAPAGSPNSAPPCMLLAKVLYNGYRPVNLRDCQAYKQMVMLTCFRSLQGPVEPGRCEQIQSAFNLYSTVPNLTCEASESQCTCRHKCHTDMSQKPRFLHGISEHEAPIPATD